MTAEAADGVAAARESEAVTDLTTVQPDPGLGGMGQNPAVGMGRAGGRSIGVAVRTAGQDEQ
jgi:hypothetical protein